MAAGQLLVYPDRLDHLEARDMNGFFRSMARKFRVGEFPSATTLDPTIFYQATQAQDVEGNPLPSIPSNLGAYCFPGAEFLMLEDRHFALSTDDKGYMDVTCNYRHALDGAQELFPFFDDSANALLPTPCQVVFANLNDPAGGGGYNSGILYGRMQSSLQQFTIAAVPATEPENPDNILYPIMWLAVQPISYQYPVGNNFFGGTTQYEAGELDVQLVMRTFTLEGFITDNANEFTNPGPGGTGPTRWVDDLIWTTNLKEWFGQPPGTWLCTEAHVDPIGITPEGLVRAKARYEWQNSPLGWDPYAVFIDPYTQRPPSGIAPNGMSSGIPPGLTGPQGGDTAQPQAYQQVLFYRRIDYDYNFGSYIGGGGTIPSPQILPI